MALRGRDSVLGVLMYWRMSNELSAQIGDGGEDGTGDDVALDPGEPHRSIQALSMAWLADGQRDSQRCF